MMAWHDETNHYTLEGLRRAGWWKEVRRLTPELVDASYAAFGKYPMVIQPNLVFKQRSKAAKTNSHSRAKGQFRDRADALSWKSFNAPTRPS